MNDWEISKKVDRVKPLLDDISPTFCLAKWLYVQIHLPHGLTQSCYHPPTHKIPLEELKERPSALHNTKFKVAERKQMAQGKQPPGCEYCWKLEKLNQTSDRLYKSSEDWAFENYDYVTDNDHDFDVKPTYLEVNFSHACNQKCIYCSPHLSNTWYEEMEQYGPFKLKSLGKKFEHSKTVTEVEHLHNDIKYLEQQGKLPFEIRQKNKIKKKDNPYIQAFWKWLPEIYQNLRHFRMTGGEPLMHKDTYKVLDYALRHKNDKLQMSVTSNFSPIDNKLVDKFINKLFDLSRAKSIEHFTLHVSLDSIGKRAEYIRTGMNWNKIKTNIDKFLKQYKKKATVFVENPHDGTPEKDKNGKVLWKEYVIGSEAYNELFALSKSNEHIIYDVSDKSFLKELPKNSGYTYEVEYDFWLYSSHLSFINTFNILSISSIEDYLKFIFNLREKYNYDECRNRQMILFDIPILEYPNWLSVDICTEDFLQYMWDAEHYMKKNSIKNTSKFTSSLIGFSDIEIEKFQRNIRYMEDKVYSSNDYSLQRKNFKLYVDQLDKRRNTNFLKVFPEYKTFYNLCKSQSMW